MQMHFVRFSCSLFVCMALFQLDCKLRIRTYPLFNWTVHQAFFVFLRIVYIYIQYIQYIVFLYLVFRFVCILCFCVFAHWIASWELGLVGFLSGRSSTFLYSGVVFRAGNKMFATLHWLSASWDLSEILAHACSQ